MQVNLTKEQLEIILQMANQINWPGKLLENGVELKRVISDALGKGEEEGKQEPEKVE